MFYYHFTIEGILAVPEKLNTHMDAQLHIKRIGEVESVEESDMLMQAGLAAATIRDRGSAWAKQRILSGYTVLNE